MKNIDGSNVVTEKLQLAIQVTHRTVSAVRSEGKGFNVNRCYWTVQELLNTSH
jgi:hypothetical protein